MPIASTFMFLMGCCGESILRIPKTSLGWASTKRGVTIAAADPVGSGSARARLSAQAQGVLAAGHSRNGLGSAHHVIPFRPDRTRLLLDRARGSVRKRRQLRGRRKVRYLPQPRGPGGASNNPIGGFLLCIPANLPPERVELAFEAIAWMTSPEAMKAKVQNGFPVAPRFSVAADPEAAATSPIVSVVDRLAKRNLLKGWPRPPVPEYLSSKPFSARRYTGLCEERLLTRKRSRTRRTQADQVMREAGYY